MADEQHIIPDPHPLRDKVPCEAGGVDPAALERAEALVAALQGRYLDWVQEDLRCLQETFDRVLASPPEERGVWLHALHKISHDIKGQGGTFHYPLMTDIGALLCGFVAGQASLSDEEMAVVQVLIEAMRAVIDERLEGDGGDAGSKLMGSLRTVTSRTGRQPTGHPG